MRLGLALIAFSMALAAIAPAQALDTRLADGANNRWIEVTGEGSVSAAPDFARVTLGVTSTGATAGEAMAENAKAANALVSLIKAEGVAPADIQTSEVSISPMFAQPALGEKTAPAITGYSVSNNVAVTVREIPRLGALLDKAVTAGANSVYGIGFGHNDPERAPRQGAPAGGRGREAQGSDLRGRRRGQDRPAPGAHRRGWPATAHGLFPRLFCRRRRPHAHRGRRGQADREHQCAV